MQTGSHSISSASSQCFTMAGSASGSWRAPSSVGGLLAHDNPQYILSVAQAGKISITLTTPSRQRMQIAVVRGPLPARDASGHYRRRLVDFTEPEFVAVSKYVSEREVSLSDLPLDPGDHLVVLFLERRGDESDYKVTASAGHLAELAPLHGVTAQSRWVNPLNGGPMVCMNPQFHLELPESCDVEIRLSHPSKEGIMFAVHPLGARRTRLRQLDEPLVMKSPFVRTTMVSLSERLPAGSHAIICMREVAGTVGPLTVTVLSLTPGLSLTELPDVPRPLAETDAREILAKYASPLGPTLLLRDPYEELAAHCRARGAMFRDPHFPPTDDSLNWVDVRDPRHKSYQALAPVEWRRSIDVCNTPTVFSGGIEPDDLEQGDVGDCWFCQAVANVAQRPQIVLDIFNPDWYNEFGFYTCRLYWRGSFYYVIVDDYIPTRRGKQCFAHNREDLDELWVSILEKAMAKLHGSYRLTDGKTMQAGMQLLTGGLTRSLPLSAALADEHWKVLLDAVAGKHLIGASTRSGIRGGNVGLIDDHAYAVLDARAVKSAAGELFRLVQLRNTWGNSEWTGTWSDASDTWRKFPEIGAELEHVDADDGRFWIEMGDFATYFEEAAVCKYIDRFATQKTLVSTWTEAVSGGHSSPVNPQFELILDEPSDVAAVLRNDADPRAPGDAIGLLLFEAPRGEKGRLAELPRERRAFTPFTEAAEVVLEAFSLPAGRYIFVAARFEPRQTGPLILTFYATSTRATITEMTSSPTSSRNAPIRSAFASPDLCGGPLSTANPQFALSVAASTGVTLQFAHAAAPPFAVQLFVVRVDSAGRHVTGDLNSCHVAAKSANTRAASVTLGAQLDAGDYAVVVCASERGKQGEFTMSATSSNHVTSVRLFELAAPKFAHVAGSWKKGKCGGPISAENPQAALELCAAADEAVTLTLTRTNGSEDGLIMYVIESKQAVDDFDHEEVEIKSEYLAESDVMMTFKARPFVQYVVVMAQEKEDVEEKFTLRATTRGTAEIRLRLL